MLDQIGVAHMSQGSLTNFTMDRFNCSNSALALNGGWTQVPPGIYFNAPEFTISVWVYPNQIVGTWARIIDFANGPDADNIIFGLTEVGLNPNFQIYSGASVKFLATSSLSLVLNEWQFFAVTFNGINFYFYINGQLTTTISSSFIMPTLSRTNCYIGKSNWANGYSSSYIDDLKFFNKSFTQNEIVELMDQNLKRKTFQVLTYVSIIELGI
jgi:hypothetical protein